MASVRVRIQAALGGDVVITGWSYRLLPVMEVNSAQVAVQAVAGGIGDAGNARVLMVLDEHQLDPLADADALEVLRNGPEGARLAYEVAYRRVNAGGAAGGDNRHSVKHQASGILAGPSAVAREPRAQPGDRLDEDSPPILVPARKILHKDDPAEAPPS